jgi:hypothetical protein
LEKTLGAGGVSSKNSYVHVMRYVLFEVDVWLAAVEIEILIFAWIAWSFYCFQSEVDRLKRLEPLKARSLVH